MFHQAPLKKGDVVRCVTATGGGYGDPRARPRGGADVKDGFITREQAAAEYGSTPAEAAG